jgi:hypothetical protein
MKHPGGGSCSQLRKGSPPSNPERPDKVILKLGRSDAKQKVNNITVEHSFARTAALYVWEAWQEQSGLPAFEQRVDAQKSVLKISALYLPRA